MSLADDFAAAQGRVKQLSKSPSNDELLELYSLYKQGSMGNVQGARPGMLDFRGRAKYDAWKGRQGMSQESAMTAYVALVGKLAVKYG